MFELNKEKAVTITHDIFEAGNQPNMLGILASVAYMDVPLNHMCGFKGGVPFRAYIKARHEEAVTVNADLVYTVQLPVDFVESARSKPVLPASYHPDVAAYISSDNGTTWTKTTVNAINYPMDRVTITKTATTNKVRVFYLCGAGELQMRVLRSAGSDGVSIKLFNMPLKALHEVDQANRRSAPMFSEGVPVYPLPQQYRFSIDVNAPVPIYWVKEAEHDVAISTVDAEGVYHDYAQVAAWAEQMLRGGAI